MNMFKRNCKKVQPIEDDEPDYIRRAEEAIRNENRADNFLIKVVSPFLFLSFVVTITAVFYCVISAYANPYA